MDPRYKNMTVFIYIWSNWSTHKSLPKDLENLKILLGQSDPFEVKYYFNVFLNMYAESDI